MKSVRIEPSVRVVSRDRLSGGAKGSWKGSIQDIVGSSAEIVRTGKGQRKRSSGVQRHLHSHANSSVFDKKCQSLFLYDEDMKKMPRAVTYLNTKKRFRKNFQKNKTNLGCMLGVYLPTIQHIMGLLVFIRHHWVVGHTGLLEGAAMVLLCSATTFFTAISVSAIATNGILQSGGSYYLLSRNLGAECGGSIGICYYLANTFATCLYLLGSIELMLVFMAPQFAYFGDIHHDPWNNFRIYGTFLLLVLTLITALGVRIVQLLAPFSLVCVIVSILSIIVGAFVNNSNEKVCMVGDKLMTYPDEWLKEHNLTQSETEWCSKEPSSYLYEYFCEKKKNQTVCDQYFMDHEVKYVSAIPGFDLENAHRNLYQHYMEDNEVAKGIKAKKGKVDGEVTNDFATNFIVLCAIYFPSVTGILTGVNMSGDLKNPRRSIPVGTIMAQLTCSVVFMLMMMIYGISIKGEVLRDKMGESLGGELVTALLCWPNKWVVLVGAFSSSLGAGLQCLVSAPRLLQAIASDEIVPLLNPFKKLNKSGEPIRALVITFFIAEIGMLIANIDSVAPIIDISFLVCYLFVNLICVMQTILKLPNWRPKLKYYHWTQSLLGAILNLLLCFMAGLYFALAAFLLTAIMFIYILFKGSEKEWGDGLKGLLMTFTEYALHSLEEEAHSKNWRPQLLVLDFSDDSAYRSANPHLLSFVSQLKHSRGLTIYASVLEGDPISKTDAAETLKKLLQDELRSQEIKGFVKVVTCTSANEGIMLMIQCVGIGSLSHNTVLLSWPDKRVFQSTNTFIRAIQLAYSSKNALLILKSTNYPEKHEIRTGNIDIWWLIHDGGMLILLSFMLKKDRVWKDCHIRIFTVAHDNDNCEQIKQQLESYLYEIRIDAEVFVVEMLNDDLLLFEIEQTIDMKTRVQLMRMATEKRLSTESEMSKSQLTSSTQTTQGNRDSIVSKTTQHNLDNVVHMLRKQNAVQLNTIIQEKSMKSDLIIINLPAPPAILAAEENYMAYLEILSDHLPCVLFVRGSGKEIVTVYS